MRQCLLAYLLAATAAFAQSAPDAAEAGRLRFNIRCAGCHGADGLGGERAAAIGARERKRLQTEATIRDVIRQGIPEEGMPGFNVPDEELAHLTAFVRSRVQPLSQSGLGGNPRAGESLYFGEGHCVDCHMLKGRGGLKGPDLTETGTTLTLNELATSLRNPNARRLPGYEVASARLRSGSEVRGFIRIDDGFHITLQGFDQRLHLLSHSDIASIKREDKPLMPPFQASREQLLDLAAFLSHVPDWKPNGPTPTSTSGIPWSQIAKPERGAWPTYHGNLGGNRYSELSQINRANITRLAPKWIFPAGNGRSLEMTPIVVNGVMYVTAVNTVIALDARNGQQIWQYTRPRSKGLVGDASSGINRGVAVLGDRIFLVTDNAHLLALHALTGALLWDVEMADSRHHYGSTSAPLIAGDLVISGVSGGDEGIRGFLSAFKASTGEKAWTFWTVPAPGDPEASTWVGRALEHGCGATWLTGTYDTETQTLFWPVGNPCPDFNGDERKGDNLYTDSVIALDPQTGKLKWYYQFTPHDLHDWDATETPMLVDANYKGQPRKLLLQGNRNGFFYVLDRSNGKLLYASPFVKKLTWAKGIGPDGRPILDKAWEPTEAGIEVCPSMDGATNWMSTAYNPGTGLFYLMALEKCNIFSKSPAWWKQGESFYGGASRSVPNENPRKYLRAIDIQTGKITWEYEQPGQGETWGGILSTAGGLVFFGNDSGAFTALDAQSGKPVWNFSLNAHWHASPMTYLVGGKQYIAVAAGQNVIAFGVPD